MKTVVGSTGALPEVCSSGHSEIYVEMVRVLRSNIFGFLISME
jgi:hypothetical protein